MSATETITKLYVAAGDVGVETTDLDEVVEAAGFGWKCEECGWMNVSEPVCRPQTSCEHCGEAR